MRKLQIVSSPVSRAVQEFSAIPKYYPGEVNRCPGCGGVGWQVGRIYAECAKKRCGYPLAIVLSN